MPDTPRRSETLIAERTDTVRVSREISHISIAMPGEDREQIELTARFRRRIQSGADTAWLDDGFVRLGESQLRAMAVYQAAHAELHNALHAARAAQDTPVTAPETGVRG